MNKDTIVNLVLSNVIKHAQEELLKVPVLRQTFDYDCGTNATQTLLGYYGFDIREEKLLKWLKTDRDKGTDTEDIVKFAESLGFEVIYKNNMTIKELKNWIKMGHPVIVNIQAWAEDPKTDYSKTIEEGHFVVAIGYGNGKIFFQDPAMMKHGFLDENEFLERWRDYDAGSGKKLIQHGIVFTGKEPKNINQYVRIK